MTDNGHSIFILGPARTPIGKMMGGLATIPATQLGATAIKAAIEAGSHRLHRHEEMAAADLEMAGWKVDYIAVRSQSALAVPGPHDKDLVVLGAAWLGKTRLIDNLFIEPKSSGSEELVFHF